VDKLFTMALRKRLGISSDNPRSFHWGNR